MKTTITDGKVNIRPAFPILARSIKTGIIVLFTNERSGMVIHAQEDAPNYIGEYSRTWISCFDGKVWKIIDKPISIRFEP
jgi:hypothetical protein